MLTMLATKTQSTKTPQISAHFHWQVIYLVIDMCGNSLLPHPVTLHIINRHAARCVAVALPYAAWFAALFATCCIYLT